MQEVLDEAGQPLGWAVEGRPADCVKLALRELLPEPPDLIVSGLNAGSNAGINVLYSGTVAAAIEGAFFRRTSIACSLEYTQAASRSTSPAAPTSPAGHRADPGPAARRRQPVQREHPRPGTRAGHAACASCRRTSPRTSRSSTAAPTRAAGSTSGRRPDFTCPDPHPDTDVTALAEGYITVTPLQFNLTHHALLRKWPGGS